MAKSFNPSDRKSFARLRRAREFSRLKLQPFRRKRHRRLKQLVGFNYSDDGADDLVPINLHELATNIYVRQLSASAPAVLVTTFEADLKEQAVSFELAMNELIREIELEKALRRWVLDAMMSVGMMKTGITQGAMAEFDGYLHDAGQPFADVVDLDDWCHDMTANRYEQVQFAGNQYWLPYEMAMDVLFKGQDLQPTEPKPVNESGDERSETISQGTGLGGDGTLKDRIQLWDLWLPFENVVVTMAEDQPSEQDRPVLVIDWDGPEHGPYHRLSFSEVPNSVMPLPPAAVWEDLHNIANVIFRKLSRQAERQKTNPVFRGGAGEEDAKARNAASDGEWIKENSPDSIREVKSGGIDPQNLAFFLQAKDIYSWTAGNIDALGGLSPQSETLGQDQLLAAAASQRLVDMQDRTTEATRTLIESLAWWEITDPIRTRSLTRTIKGTKINVPVDWSPETREGDILQFQINLEPYSMTHSTPGSKLQAIANVFDRFIAPYIAMIESQGMTIDFQVLMSTISKYGNLPELNDIMTFAGTPLTETNGSGRARQSPTTTRNIVRRSIPGASRHGADQALSQILAGGNAQASERAAIGRPKG